MHLRRAIALLTLLIKLSIINLNNKRARSI